ncbi:MAG: DUF3592 domain-containing protein [Bacteroidia bacterium]
MLYAVFFVAGLLLLVFVIHKYLENKKLIRNGIRTTGKVIGLKKEKDSDGDEMFRPVYEFFTNTNQRIVFESDYSLSFKIRKIGDEVRIIYDWQNPKNAKVDTLREFYLPVIFGFVIALVFIVIGCRFFFE